METQLRSLGSNWNSQLITLVIVVVIGSICYPVGGAYHDAGSAYETVSASSLFASEVGVKAVSAFMIVGGLLQMGLPVFICWNLAKNKSNKMLAFLSWIATVIVTVFMFTSGIMAAQTYNPAARYAQANDLSISDYETKLRNMYNFGLTDAIFTFILGWPACLYLFIASTYQRQRVENQVEDKQREEPDDINPGEEESRPDRASPPKSIDLDNFGNSGDVEKRMGSVMYNENLNNNLGRQADPDVPRFNNIQPQGDQSHPPQSPKSNAGDGRRNKTQFAHSQPDFNVEMAVRPARSSVDNKDQGINSSKKQQQSGQQ